MALPIKKINEAVKIVSNNHYAYRLPITGTDELNELSGNFNIMCEAIENNIKNYKSAIDNFVHEVKTPLTSIIGYAEMIQSYQCTDECREDAVNYILMQSRRLNSLVRKIMGFLIVESYNARDDKYEDLLKAGIIDPTKVSRVGLVSWLTVTCSTIAEKAV